MIKTTSLETAKLLKDAGFRQDTYFHREINDGVMRSNIDPEFRQYHYAVPTTDELLDEMTNENLIMYSKSIPYGSNVIDLIDLFRDPNKVALIWLWLKTEGLI